MIAGNKHLKSILSHFNPASDKSLPKHKRLKFDPSESVREVFLLKAYAVVQVDGADLTVG